MSSDFNFTVVASWIPGNVRLKPNFSSKWARVAGDAIAAREAGGRSWHGGNEGKARLGLGSRSRPLPLLYSTAIPYFIIFWGRRLLLLRSRSRARKYFLIAFFHQLITSALHSWISNTILDFFLSSVIPYWRVQSNTKIYLLFYIPFKKFLLYSTKTYLLKDFSRSCMIQENKKHSFRAYLASILRALLLTINFHVIHAKA